MLWVDTLHFKNLSLGVLRTASVFQSLKEGKEIINFLLFHLNSI